MLTPEDFTSIMADRPVAVRVLAALSVAVSVIHVTIWLLIAAIGGHLDRPWWLLVTAPLGVVVAAAWWLTAPRTGRGGDPHDALL